MSPRFKRGYCLAATFGQASKRGVVRSSTKQSRQRDSSCSNSQTRCHTRCGPSGRVASSSFAPRTCAVASATGNTEHPTASSPARIDDASFGCLASSLDPVQDAISRLADGPAARRADRRLRLSDRRGVSRGCPRGCSAGARAGLRAEPLDGRVPPRPDRGRRRRADRRLRPGLGACRLYGCLADVIAVRLHPSIPLTNRRSFVSGLRPFLRIRGGRGFSSFLSLVYRCGSDPLGGAHSRRGGSSEDEAVLLLREAHASDFAQRLGHPWPAAGSLLAHAATLAGCATEFVG